MQCLLLSENAVPIVRVLNLISNKLCAHFAWPQPRGGAQHDSDIPPIRQFDKHVSPFSMPQSCGQPLQRPVSTVRGLVADFALFLRCSALKPCCCV